MLEAMARASYTIVRPVAFEQVVMYQSVREAESLQMLDIIYNNLYLDFHCLYDFGTACTAISKHIYYDDDLVSTLAGLKNSITGDAGKVSTAWMNQASK